MAACCISLLYLSHPLLPYPLAQSHQPILNAAERPPELNRAWSGRLNAYHNLCRKEWRSWWLPGQGSLPSPVLCTWMAAAEGQGGRGSIALVLPERSARLLTASCSPPVVLINHMIMHDKTTVCWQGLWLEAKADEGLRLRHNERNRFHHGRAACT
jgi:hypothetical protein